MVAFNTHARATDRPRSTRRGYRCATDRRRYARSPAPIASTSPKPNGARWPRRSTSPTSTLPKTCAASASRAPHSIVIVPVRDTPVRRPVTGAQVLTVGDGAATTRRDQLATEEPLEIRVHGPGQEPAPFAVAMRTPGNDFELAVGLC